jgi:para-aminobenzoate synthetase component 1
MFQFQQKLNAHKDTISDLLLHLQDLTGLVYLHDQQNPIIAFLPQQYLICQSSISTFFEQIEFNYYQKSTVTPSPIEFVNFDSAKFARADESHSFQGGYIGFLSYDYSTQFFVETSQRSQPSFFLGQYLSFLKFINGEWIFHSDDANAKSIYEWICERLAHPSPETSELTLIEKCQPRWTQQQYLNAFQQVQDYIKAGDCYQINLTQEFSAKAHGDLLSQAEKFWDLTHAPYAGYLKLGDFELLSCSPELFIEFQSNRNIKTRPIKGTMPRFENAKKDQISKQKLRESEKDQAENLMIVDLLRNDLSVYAEIGTVKTTKLFEIESFNQVHHMVSEITATLKADIHPMQMLLSALPGGSITGAPKIRAMQIIEELEGAPRGAYCGSMGYFNFDGTGRWNILIRSIQKYQAELSLWAGGGITIASDAEAEYQECFDKISAMLDLLNTQQKSKP